MGKESAEHHELAQLSRKWLWNKVSGKGCRGGEKIRIGSQYIPDYVALATFQMRFTDRYWFQYNREQPWEFQGEGNERRRVFKRNFINLLIFEAKATRSDFISTFGPNVKNDHINRHFPKGNFHWIVAPKGLIKIEEVPTFWGLLEKRGKGLREIVKPYWFWQPEDYINIVAHEILWNGRG